MIVDRDPGDEDDGKGRFLRTLTNHICKAVENPGVATASESFTISWLNAVKMGLHKKKVYN
jgi:hypothetical protein